MPNPHYDEARRSHGDKLDELTGKRGEHPTERASRIVATPNPSAKTDAQGSAAQPPTEEWIGAPARQVSNLGNVRK